MKRKVIQIANSTQLVSLPRKWALRFNIKKGEELEVEERGNKIVVSTEKSFKEQSIDIDITGLDRTSIMLYIRSLYRMGFDEIRVNFKNPTTNHFRLNKKMNIISVIHTEVNRLVGFEVVQQKEDSCIIKDISELSQKDFEDILKRIFILFTDASRDLFEGLKNKDITPLQTIEEKHDSITKFVSYCLRMLNKKGYSDPRKTSFIYHIIATIDCIIDVLKYAARDAIEFKKRLDPKTISVLEKIDGIIHKYYELFYRFDIKKSVEIIKTREFILNDIKSLTNKVPNEDLLLLSNMENAVELIKEITETRAGME